MWPDENEYGNASTDDLYELIEDVTGEPRPDAFDDWLYEPGKPSCDFCRALALGLPALPQSPQPLRVAPRALGVQPPALDDRGVVEPRLLARAHGAAARR